MIELPEAFVLAKQLNETIHGKTIEHVIANQSPHKFAWYHKDPQGYHNLLYGKKIGRAKSIGGLIEIEAEDIRILLGDGVKIKFHEKAEKRPQKHQLLIEFSDFTALSCVIQMYGGIWCYKNGEFDNPYFLLAMEKPSPLTHDFNREYFEKIISNANLINKSLKALLATEQRIPGLGNGVLQDILYNAGLHPKKKVSSLSDNDKELLFTSIKDTLKEMVVKGGRDVETDLFGHDGGYVTKLSKKTAGTKCQCGGIIKKEAYMGGSIYYCDTCQK